MKRYETTVEDGVVYIDTDNGLLLVGELDSIVASVGGHAWTIEYTDWETDRYGDLDTSDEGLTVDVVDMIEAMTHGDRFVETLRAHPSTVDSEQPDGTDDDPDLSPRAGLFVGKLLENLESGLE